MPNSDTRSRRNTFLVACCAAAYGAAGISAVHAAGPTTAPSTDYKAEIKDASNRDVAARAELLRMFHDPAPLHDPDKAALLRSKIVELVRASAKANAQYAWYKDRVTKPTDPGWKPQSFGERVRWAEPLRDWPYLIAVGDAGTIAAADAMAASPDPEQSPRGRLAKVAADWLRTADDAGRQRELDRYAAVVKQADAKETDDLLIWLERLPTASPDQARWRLARISAAFPDSALARSHAVMLQQEAVLDANKGRPVTIEGTTLDGKMFTTDEWKGKVVLIDFWATWCAPCKAALPHLKETYHRYHDQGLEVLSVSNDYRRAALEKFLAADHEMPWPELFDQKAAEDSRWHSMSTKYGVHGIPQVFLIDRNGVCRSLDSSEIDAMIPKLLADTAPAAGG